MPSKRLPACISSELTMACAALPIDHQHAIIGIEVVQVFADAEHAAITIHMSLKCPVDAGFRKRMLEKMPRGNAHIQSKLVAIGGRR